MSELQRSYVFGPVPSRRLGRSLGVDLLPFKTCSYNCVYCQLGRTTDQTLERKEYVPSDAVLEEIRETLRHGPPPDYITFSGSGEPTLHTGLGRLIEEVKGLTDIPVAVITNSSLLWRPEVRRELMPADLLVPSLDAGDSADFQHVNRPHPAISFEPMLEGLIEFSQAYRGELWLEVFLLDGVNAIESNVRKLAEHAKRIRCTRVQLNTVARPPTEEYAYGVPEDEMKRFAAMFGDKATVIVYPAAQAQPANVTTTRGEILALVQRRPCTLEDVAAGLSIHTGLAVKHLQAMLDQGTLVAQWRGPHRYFAATREHEST
jgi:wyosine [tRNA(Phe)-imidazoG37] synthetase (radical SAM superfamily)